MDEEKLTKYKKKKEVFWLTEDVKTLISEYKREPVLWDISNPNYCKKDARHSALEKVKEVLEDRFSVEEINEKLKHLRNYYTRELTKIRTSKKSECGTDEVVKSKWPYYYSLDSFLRPQITPRKSLNNMEMPSQESQDKDNEASEVSENLHGTQIPDETRFGHYKKRKMSAPMEVMAEAVKVLSDIRTKKSQQQEPITHNIGGDSAFVAYITSELEKIKNDRIKNNLKLRIISMIFESQYEDSNPHPFSYQQQSHIWQNMQTPARFGSYDSSSMHGSVSPSPSSCSTSPGPSRT